MYLTACPATSTHVAGALTPGGANVTATQGNGTYTLSNGIVSIVITCADATISTWTYHGTNVLAGGDEGGMVYWELEAGNGTCTLTSDPTTNGGDQAEVRVHTTGSTNNLDVDIDYAMLRGSSGFYATGILTHAASYAATNGGEWRSNVYNGSIFDWNSLDALRNGADSAGGATGWLDTTEADWVNGTAVPGAPKEVEQAPDGVYACKYSWTADFGDTDAWGWSSSTMNIGMFIALGSNEYYNGGPKKRELMGSMLNGPDLLNMLGGSHYTQNEVSELIPAGTQLSKVYGPFFYYNNSVSAGTANANSVLFADAIAQAKAEQAAWPYTWFVNPTGGDGDYVQESGRGTVTGTLTIDTSSQACTTAEAIKARENPLRARAAGFFGTLNGFLNNGSSNGPMDCAIGASFVLGSLLMVGLLSFRSRRVATCSAVFLLAVAGVVLAGCGGGGGGSSTAGSSTSGMAPKGTYTLTIVGTDTASSSITATATATLTID